MRSREIGFSLDFRITGELKDWSKIDPRHVENIPGVFVSTGAEWVLTAQNRVEDPCPEVIGPGVPFPGFPRPGCVPRPCESTLVS